MRSPAAVAQSTVAGRFGRKQRHAASGRDQSSIDLIQFVYGLLLVRLYPRPAVSGQP